MKHTPGVKATIASLKDWSVFPKRKYGTWHLSIPREDGKVAMRWGIQLAGLGEFPDDEAAAIGERIESCLNACAGIADPAALRRERDELLAALKGLLKESQWFTKERQGQYGESYRPTDGEAESQAAILKAEGGAA